MAPENEEKVRGGGNLKKKGIGGFGEANRTPSRRSDHVRKKPCLSPSEEEEEERKMKRVRVIAENR